MIFDSWYNGLDDSGYRSYNQSSFAYLKHINVHKTLGLAELEFEMQADPIVGKDRTEAGYLATDNFSNVLLFSRESGKIYKRGAGSYTIYATNPNGAHRGAFFYNGIFYFVAENGKVGWMRGIDTSTLVWDHGNIGNIRVNHVPIYGWYTKLYIGGSDNVWVIDQDIVNSQITPGTLTKTGLNLPRTWAVTDMRDLDVNLIWGAYAENNGSIGQYRRFADSFQNVDRTDGPINTFFGSSNSNVIFALAGSDGDIIHYTGAQAVLRKRIPDVSLVLPNPYNDAIVDGRGLVAVNGKIFSYHQRKNGHPFALTHAYTCTGGEDAEIISIQEQTNLLGDDQLFVSWTKDGISGLDSINYNKRAQGLIVTPISEWFQESASDERNSKSFVEPKRGYMVHYHSLPDVKSKSYNPIEIKASLNNDVEKRIDKDFGQVHHQERMLFTTKKIKQWLSKTRLTQGYIYVNGYEDQSPKIRSIELY